METFNALHLRALLDGLTRLYFVSLGTPVHRLYPTGLHQDPEVDQDLLIDLIERSRNAWRPVWRSGGNRAMDSLKRILEDAYPGILDKSK